MIQLLKQHFLLLLEIFKQANKNNIDLKIFPSHTSTLLSPARGVQENTRFYAISNRRTEAKKCSFWRRKNSHTEQEIHVSKIYRPQFRKSSCTFSYWNELSRRFHLTATQSLPNTRLTQVSLRWLFRNWFHRLATFFQFFGSITVFFHLRRSVRTSTSGRKVRVDTCSSN